MKNNSPNYVTLGRIEKMHWDFLLQKKNYGEAFKHLREKIEVVLSKEIKKFQLSILEEKKKEEEQLIVLCSKRIEYIYDNPGLVKRFIKKLSKSKTLPNFLFWKEIHQFESNLDNFEDKEIINKIERIYQQYLSKNSETPVPFFLFNNLISEYLLLY